MFVMFGLRDRLFDILGRVCVGGGGGRGEGLGYFFKEKIPGSDGCKIITWPQKQ